MEAKNRIVRVSVQARDFRFEGILEVPTTGYRGRVLDHLDGDADFLALTDALLYKAGEETSEEPITYDVLLLRKSAIEFAIPLNEPR